MKKLRRVFTVLLAIVGIVVLSACKAEEIDPIIEVTEFNALGEWVDGGDSVYTINTNTEDELDFAYAKGLLEFPYMMKDVSETDLSTFKKLVVTVEGTGTMLLKLETADGTAKEISLNVTGITGSYEWNLINSEDFLADVEKVLIFAAPGKTESTGTISITSMMFSVDVAQNYIIQTGFDNIPQNVNEYDGTENTFDFNLKWQNFSEDTYQITYDGTETHVSFDKAAGYEWSTMTSAVQGDFTEFNYIVLKVSGTDGQKLLAKANSFNEYENFIFLSSDIQELVLDISDMPVADKGGITEIFVFGAAGAAAAGEFVIHEAFFAKTYEYDAPVFDDNVYVAGSSFSLDTWYDGGDLNYTITKSGTDTIFDYTKTGEWTYAIAHIDGDLAGFDSLEIEVTGTLNKTALFKVEGTAGAKEEAFTFDGTRQTFTIDLTTMTPAQLSAINKVLIFAAQGSNIGSGTFTVHSVTFKKAGLNVNDLWAENEVGTYDVTMVDGVAEIDYTKGAGQQWAFMKADFALLDTTGYNTLTLTVDGVSGKTILVKPNDNGALEQSITFGDDPVTITVITSEFNNIIIFAEPNVENVSGSFEILEATLTMETYSTVDYTSSFDFTTGAFTEGDVGTYAFSVADGKTVVNYTKGAGQEWAFGRINFDSEDAAGYNTMTIVLSGTEGKTVLLKPNDSGALEQSVTFGTEPVTVVVNAESFTNLIFFGEPGTASVSGTFTIESAVLSYTYSSTDWADNGDNTYIISVVDGVTTIEYMKGVGHEWSVARLDLNLNEVDGLNTLTITLAGTNGKSVLVKPNDSGALEQTVTFGDDPVTLTFTADSFYTIIIFGEAGVTNVSGTFTILETILSYTEVVE